MSVKTQEVKEDIALKATSQTNSNVQACCAPSQQTSCCAPSEKASCCGASASTGTCGCK